MEVSPYWAGTRWRKWSLWRRCLDSQNWLNSTKTKEVLLRGEPKGEWCFEPQVNEAMIRMGGLPSRTP